MQPNKSAAPSALGGNGTTTENKDRHFASQSQKLYAFFLSHTTAMYAAERYTGVCRPNCCRLLRELEDSGFLQRVRKGPCPISGFSAWYFTADQSQFKPVGAYQQLLFENKGGADE